MKLSEEIKSKIKELEVALTKELADSEGKFSERDFGLFLLFVILVFGFCDPKEPPLKEDQNDNP